MNNQSTPADPNQAQDPARSYERAKPEAEPGMGSLKGNPDATPTARPDEMDEAIRNRQPAAPSNPQDQFNQQAVPRAEQPEQPDHSMFDEEPDGWDLAPTDIHDPRQQRHPRREGKGGVP